MKLASFDLEIMKEIPDDSPDWKKHTPFGISCAAVAVNDVEKIMFWHNGPQLSQAECQAIVRDLQQLTRDGYTILTWNGCSFDFNVLAMESGLYDECGELAMNHIDMMVMVTFQQGHYLSLQKALLGAGLVGKKKTVELSDGTVINNMNGAQAPKLWARGEYDAVLSYLEDDVIQPLYLAEDIEGSHYICWTSNKGYDQEVEFERLLTVRECFDIPEPDVSWMDKPPTREQFIEWIPNREKYF